MNALAPAPAPGLYADALPADDFAAWRILGNGKADPIEIAAGTLAEALDQAKINCIHKQVLVIRHTDYRTRKITAHFYRIKRSTRNVTYRPALDGGPPVREGLLEAEPVTSMEVTAFSPVEPFRWSPGADVVGVDRSLVSQ